MNRTTSTTIESAGTRPFPAAFYFGCIDQAGHYFHEKFGGWKSTLTPGEFDASIPWTIGDMDGSLLKNGKHPDVYDGKVFWTVGGRPILWHAFIWWDNSVDKRGACNSGFYVRGFDFKQEREAFEFACEAWPNVVSRQRQPLVLQ